jgi:hypothetical protein
MDDPSLGFGQAPIGDEAESAVAAVQALEAWLMAL